MKSTEIGSFSIPIKRILRSQTVKQVILIRKDLNMRKGKMCAQAAHASMAFLKKMFDDHLYNQTTNWQLNAKEFDEQIHDDVITKWFDSGHTKIVLGVNSEEELVSLFEQAKAAGLRSHLITDLGITEFAGVHTKTAVAIGPNLSDEIDKIISHLTLL